MIGNLKNKLRSLGVNGYVQAVTFFSGREPLLLFALGLAVLTAGLAEVSHCAGSLDSPPGKGVEEGDWRIEIVVTRIFQLIEGNLGALIMTIAGLLAIISAALGAFRAALSLLIVAVGAFILRSLVDIFFNYNENFG